MEKYKILFVCLGNICRSPAAETIARAVAQDMGVADRFEFDSAGLYGGHAGEKADKRMRVHAARRGYDITHISRPVRMSDFENFDLIVAMDDSNFSRLKGFARTLEEEGKVVKMIDYARNHPYNDCVPDPYYEGAEGFEHVLDLLEDACSGLLTGLVEEGSAK